jgi:hypothetical protein
MGISIVVFFFTYSGLKLTKLNILGNEFDLPNSYIVDISLWIIFAYWSIRYFQYLPRTSIYMTYEQKLLEIIGPYATKVYESNLKNLEIEKPKNTQHLQCEFKLLQWRVMPSGRNPFAKKATRIYYDIHISTPNGRTTRPGQLMQIELPDDFMFDLKVWWSAINYTTWRTPFVSEYVIPPLLAFLAASASIGLYAIRLIHEH